MTPSQIAVNDIGNAEDFLAAIEGTIKNFNDGDLVSGIVVQIDREEVLLDIGYKTEGVIHRESYQFAMMSIQVNW